MKNCGIRYIIKKTFLLFVLAVTVLAATGCKGSSGGGAKGVLSKPAKDVYKDIEAMSVLPEMLELDAEFIGTYYGVDTEKLADYYFSMALVSLNADAVIIAQAKDAKDVDTIEAQLQNLLDAKAAEMQNYLPDMYNLIKKSSIHKKGNVVYLVISEKAADIEALIDGSIE